MDIDGGKLFAHHRQIPVLLHGTGRSGRLDLVCMLMRIFNRMIFRNNLCRCLFSDARDSRNVVRGVSHQRLQINELRRSHLVFLLDVLCIIIFHLGASLLCLRNPDLYMLCGKLQKIPVAGDHRHFHAF